MGISAAGAGLWGLAYNLVAAAAIQTIGLAWTYHILATVGLVVNLFCSLLVKDRNKAVQPYQLAFDYKLFARLEFWLMLGWGFLSELGYTMLLYSLPNYAISIGLTPQQGSVVGALLNPGLCVGRPAVGYFSDALRINVATVMTGFCGSYASPFGSSQRAMASCSSLLCWQELSAAPLVDCCTRRCGSGQLEGAQ